MKDVENFAGACPGFTKCTRTEVCADKKCKARNGLGLPNTVALSLGQTSFRAVRDGLSSVGFARFSLEEHLEHYACALATLQEAAAEMPLDLTDGGAGRARLYGRFQLLPWKARGIDLHPEPGRINAFNGQFGLEYTQPATVNSAAAGKRRVFKTFGDDLYSNPLLLDVIRDLFEMVPFDPDTKAGAFVVGVHLVKLSPMGLCEAVASPPVVHRDGEPYTAAVLINRVNAKGGFNAVTQPRWHDHRMDEVENDDVLDIFTLESPLQGYIVDDLKVAHYVSPVASIDPLHPAERTILLVDFTPSRPRIVLDGIE